MDDVPIIIVAPVSDVHAVVVQRRLHDLGYGCEVCDLRDAPVAGISGGIESSKTPYFQWASNTIDESVVVWWRRVNLPSAGGGVWDRGVKNFLEAEWKYGLQGLLFATGCQIINNPFHEASAIFKPIQLAAARRVGLAIPDTCITNNDKVAVNFIKHLNDRSRRCVCKPLTAPRYEMAETRIITIPEVNAESLALAPVIFQECVEKGTDIRVSIFGDEVYGASVITHHADLVDWRLDPLISFSPYQLPDRLSSQLVFLLRELQLDMGSIDVRIDREGEPFFFEINPSGQFLFLEAEADLPVSISAARLLIREHHARRRIQRPERSFSGQSERSP